jgi:acyl carrier protein
MGRLSDSALSARAKQVIIEVLDLGMSADQLADQTSLYSSALRMDSLTLLHLMVALEKEFGVIIDDEDVMNAELETVASLLGIVRQASDKGAQAEGRQAMRGSDHADQ